MFGWLLFRRGYICLVREIEVCIFSGRRRRFNWFFLGVFLGMEGVRVKLDIVFEEFRFIFYLEVIIVDDVVIGRCRYSSKEEFYGVEVKLVFFIDRR